MHDECDASSFVNFPLSSSNNNNNNISVIMNTATLPCLSTVYSLLSRAEAERYWLGITMGLGSRRPAHLPLACGLRSAEATPTNTTTRPPHSLCRHLSSLHHTLRPPWWRYLPRHFRQDGKYEWSEDRNRNTLMEKFLKFHFRGDYFCFIIKLFKCQREFINKSLWKIWICEY